MTVREGQIRLCHTMMDALFGRDVALCDAGGGLGKTYADLLTCVLWQLQRLRQMRRPAVISTASITLQNVILEKIRIVYICCFNTERTCCGPDLCCEKGGVFRL